MATVYMRADGSAANRLAATGPRTDATKCLSVATHNGIGFVAGDTIIVSSLGGEFTTRLWPQSNGSAGSPITYTTENGERPIFRVAGDALTVSNRSYVTIERMQFISTAAGGQACTAAGTMSNVSASDCDFEGLTYGWNGAAANTNLTITNCRFSANIANIGIYLYGASNAGLSITGNTFAKGGIRINNASSGTVSNNAITGNPNAYQLNLQTCANLTVDSNTLTGQTFANQYAFFAQGVCTGTTVSNLTINSATQIALYLNGASGIAFSNVTLNDCTSGNVGYVVASSASCTFTDVTLNRCAGPFFIGGTSNNLTFTRFQHLDGIPNCNAGMQIQDGAHHITINDSKVLRNSYSDGFIWAGDGAAAAHDLTFNRCEAAYNGRKTSTSDGDGFSGHGDSYNVTLNYCLMHHNTASGWFHVQQASVRMNNCVNYGNGGDWRSVGGLDQIRGGAGVSTTVNATSGIGCVMRNCIVAGNYPCEVYASAAADLDYNCYNELTAAKFATLDAGSTYISWATYHATKEAHSVHADPGFTNAAAGNFILAAHTSPAVDAGTDVDLTTDYAGNAVPGTDRNEATPDIGAYQMTAAQIAAQQLVADKATVAAELAAQAIKIVGTVTVLEQSQVGKTDSGSIGIGAMG